MHEELPGRGGVMGADGERISMSDRVADADGCHRRAVRWRRASCLLLAVLSLAAQTAMPAAAMPGIASGSGGPAAAADSAGSHTAARATQSTALEGIRGMTPAEFFRHLKRPDSPNNWLVAPADFAVKPDAVAPVFDAPVAVLREAVRAVALQAQQTELVLESADGMHIAVTTPLMRFVDDVWILFIAAGPQRAAIAIYSASRVGYWDLGTNRRRVRQWLAGIEEALARGTR